jgi:aryl-alcohol dehydrogenase-like predicted oxidoreductase
MKRCVAAKLGLGAAQFGAGHTPTARRAATAEVGRILQSAAAGGVQLLDSAGSAEAEAIIGRACPRPNPFRLTVITAPLHDGVEAVEAAVRLSLKTLQVERADTLIVRRGSELFGANGPALWDRVKRLKAAGLFDRIGVAAEPGEDALGIARRFRPDVMQLPASLLDQRLIQQGALAEIAALGVEVVLRSIFLQGLLFLPRDGLPAGLAEAGPRLSRIRRTIAEAGADPMQAALAFALARPEASAVVVDVASAGELGAILAAASAPAPQLDWDDLALDHAVALDPHRWAAA